MLPASTRHFCDYPDCNRSFQRPEHLKRHKLNHTNHTIPCPRCGKPFFRNDLLQRHLSLKHAKDWQRNGAGRSSSDSPASSDHHIPQDHSDSMLMNGVFLPDPSLPGSSLTPSGHIFSHPEDLFQDHNDIPHHTLSNPTLGFTGSNLYPTSEPASSYGWLFPHATNSSTSGDHMCISMDQNNLLPSQALDVSNLPLGLGEMGEVPLTAETHNHLFISIGMHTNDTELIATPEACSHLLKDAISRINAFMPIFHEPTLNFNLIPRQLCATIICIGLLLSERNNAHEFGCSLLSELRTEMLRLVERVPLKTSSIWVLEAMMLIEMAGMFFADRINMELSDIFHGTVVTLARRLRLFYSNREPQRAVPFHAQTERWLEWVQLEKFKRLGFCIYVFDVQHMLLWGHERSVLSPLAMKLELPASDKIWSSPNAKSWLAEMQREPPRRIHFDEIYRNSMSSSYLAQMLPSLDSFCCYLVIAGLVSIDLDWRDRCHGSFFDLGKLKLEIGILLDLVLDHIRAQPDAYIRSDALTMYHLASISLQVRFKDLEYATNSGFSLSMKSPPEVSRAALVSLLTKSRVGTEPSEHAIQILGICLLPSTRYHSHLETSALYLSALTLWAFSMSHNPTAARFPIKTAAPAEALDDMLAAIHDGQGEESLPCWLVIAGIITSRLGRSKHDNAKEYCTVLQALMKAASL